MLSLLPQVDSVKKSLQFWDKWKRSLTNPPQSPFAKGGLRGLLLPLLKLQGEKDNVPIEKDASHERHKLDSI